MKYLYSILCFLLFAAAGTSAQQKDALTEFAAKMASSKAEFHYSFTLDDGRVKMTGEGTVAVQGSSYYMTGNGLEIWCDGKSRWTSDSAAREAVIESVGEGMELAANPALLVSNLDREFSWSGNGVPGTFNGSPAKVFYLKANSNAGIREASVYFDRDGKSITGAEIRLPDGSVMTFTLSSFVFSEPGPLAVFTPGEFSGGWIVTDLR
ncbi:MAG: outer membrane lipoprotein carrier protein LolA [Bacteroidales bacterium]|nr:outer membrane lipoprotein carrier protein LolA [Bacteroidales bacterium]